MREKLRAKHRERQENEVAKRTVVMCARLRRSLPLCEAGQLNIAALVGRWIDGHLITTLLQAFCLACYDYKTKENTI